MTYCCQVWYGILLLKSYETRYTVWKKLLISVKLLPAEEIVPTANIFRAANVQAVLKITANVYICGKTAVRYSDAAKSTA